MIEFPRLAAAVERAKKTVPGPTCRRTPCTCGICAAWEEGWSAVAEEVLPTLIGGCWLRTRHSFEPLYHLRTDFGSGLFDHSRKFRRSGTRGPSSWANTAVAANPYGLRDIDAICAAPPESIRGQLIRLSSEDVGVWVWGDMTTYYPGESTLVLAARGLAPEAAGEFGFRALDLSAGRRKDFPAFR